MTGSAADWQLRRLPPLCLVCSEPLEVLPGGARGVSPPRCPPPSLATYIRPPAAPRPRPATPELRPEPRAAGKGGGGGGGGFLWGGGCDSLTGALEGRRRSFYGGIYLRQDGAAAIKRERARSAPGRARKGSLPTPPLPRFPPPLSPPAGTCPTLAGLFREGVKAVGLSMEAGTFFDPVEEEDLLCSRSE